MKRVIIGIVIGLVLATSSTAIAATQGGWWTAARNVKCKGGKSLMCYPSDRPNLYGGAYTVYISDCSVAVYKDNADATDMREIFTRWQPACS